MNKTDILNLKPHLILYLQACGIKTQPGKKITCFSPAHTDSTPSLIVHEESFYCFGCGLSGDILDAAAIIEGIAREDKKAQFEAVNRVLKLSSPEIALHSRQNIQPAFTPDKEALAIIDTRLKELTQANKSKVINWITKNRGHSRETAVKMFEQAGLLYWPGKDGAISPGTLIKAGMGSAHWNNEGILYPLNTGYTLLYINNKGKTEKRRSKASRAFNPAVVPGDHLVITEGEFDAAACMAENIPAIPAGGINGIRKQTAAQSAEALSRFREIIILFDNDQARDPQTGKAIETAKSQRTEKAAIDTARALAPFTMAEIKIATIPCPGLDPDDMIRAGKTAELKGCLEKSRVYHDPEKVLIETAGKKTRELDFPLCTTIEELAAHEKAPEFLKELTNSAGAALLDRAVNGKLIYVKNENQFYFFNKNHYITLSDFYQLCYTILYKVSQHMLKEENPRERKRIFSKVLKRIGDTRWKENTRRELSVRVEPKTISCRN